MFRAYRFAVFCLVFLMFETYHRSGCIYSPLLHSRLWLQLWLAAEDGTWELCRAAQAGEVQLCLVLRVEPLKDSASRVA